MDLAVREKSAGVVEPLGVDEEVAVAAEQHGRGLDGSIVGPVFVSEDREVHVVGFGARVETDDEGCEDIIGVGAR